ncbi:hypothetical protein BAC1_00475 [uncultured bacterium]|nr:hypothetical protein BAC1_00475 [uncultured bacterium]
MLRKSFIVAVMLLAAAGQIYAGQSVPEGLETKLVTNGEFLKAAAKIISEEKSDEAASVLRLAESSRDEAIIHLKSGEYELALEDVNDSTRKAMHAIVLSSSSNDRALREAVMKEEMSLMAGRERVRKEAQLKKGLAEVEIFIKTAERLLKDARNETAALKLKETKEVYAASLEKASLGDYDNALEDVSRAYKLATAAVKDIKRSQGDILTFPKAAYTEQKDILAHELKKNDAYAFFASTMVKEGEGESSRLVSEGLTYRESAMKAVKDGGDAQAINDLKASTELLIKALRSSGN